MLKVTKHFLFKTFASHYKGNSGMSLLEVSMAMGMASVLMMGTVELIQSNNKSVKKMALSSDWNNLMALVRASYNNQDTCSYAFGAAYGNNISYVEGNTTSLQGLYLKDSSGATVNTFLNQNTVANGFLTISVALKKYPGTTRSPVTLDGVNLYLNSVYLDIRAKKAVSLSPDQVANPGSLNPDLASGANPTEGNTIALALYTYADGGNRDKVYQCTTTSSSGCSDIDFDSNLTASPNSGVHSGHNHKRCQIKTLNLGPSGGISSGIIFGDQYQSGSGSLTNPVADSIMDDVNAKTLSYTAQAHVFKSNGNEVARITNAGHVGIGNRLYLAGNGEGNPANSDYGDTFLDHPSDGRIDLYNNNNKTLMFGDRWIGIPKATVLEFGAGESKEGNAGKIGYQQFDGNALAIVGAGSDNSNRKVHLWDNLVVDKNLDVYGNITLPQNTVLEFGSGVSGKNADAGKIAYANGWDSNALNIIGAGNGSSNRKVHIWDNVEVNNDLQVNGKIKANGNIEGNNLKANGTLQAMGELYSESNLYAKENVYLPKNSVMEFGTWESKASDAGKIAYRNSWDADSLNIVGAGNSGGTRRVHIWDKLVVDSGIYTGTYEKWVRYGGNGREYFCEREDDVMIYMRNDTRGWSTGWEYVFRTYNGHSVRGLRVWCNGCTAYSSGYAGDFMTGSYSEDGNGRSNGPDWWWTCLRIGTRT